MSTEARAPTKKAQQSIRTRGRLLKVARKAFASNGYAAASLEKIASKAGVTTGAVYHQYRDKKALFRAVLEDLEDERYEKVRAVSRERAGPGRGQSLDRLAAAAEALLDTFTDPAVRQIIMIDGPAVLGMTDWHEIRSRQLLAHLVEILELQMARGVIEREPAGTLATLLIGALTSAGMVIAYADDKAAARELVGAAVERLIHRLAAAPP
jgi:AcrR family transcriptional regulator